MHLSSLAILLNILSSQTKFKQVEMIQVIRSSMASVVLMLRVVIFSGEVELSWLCRQCSRDSTLPALCRRSLVEEESATF